MHANITKTKVFEVGAVQKKLRKACVLD